MSWLTGIGSILGGLGGLFDKSPKPAGAYDTTLGGVIGQADGARKAGKQFGFNPLTLLGNSSPMAGGGGGGGAAPLASIELLTDGLQDVSDELTGKAAQDRAARELELDLAKVRLDQARSGVIGGDAVNRVASSPSPLGPGHTVVGTPTDSGFKPFGMGATKSSDLPFGYVIAPGAEVQEMPLNRTPGVFAMNNGATGGADVYIPGDSEPWGIDELLTALVVGAPQVVWHGMKDVPGVVREHSKWRASVDKAAKAEAEKYKARRDDPERMEFMRKHYPTYLD